MIGKLRIFAILALLCPTVVFGADSSVAEFNRLFDVMIKLGWDKGDADTEKELYDKAAALKQRLDENTEKLEKNYQDLKENEQSLANRTLTAVTTAATGIGGMELAMGLAQQNADKDAAADMDAYISTFRCTYGDGKSVKGGMEEIELPGGNNAELMKLRSEYVALAADLKQRKEALGLKPGIESEEILDKTQIGLYDDEFVGITSGNYESLYRAKMLGSEADQAKLDEQAESAKNRVIGGAIAAGAGLVAGIAGNAIINKDATKNKSEAILKEREEITSAIAEFIEQKKDICNTNITKAQELAGQIKTNPKLANIGILKRFAEAAQSAEIINSDEDLIKMKDNPLCP